MKLHFLILLFISTLSFGQINPECETCQSYCAISVGTFAPTQVLCSVDLATGQLELIDDFLYSYTASTRSNIYGLVDNGTNLFTLARDMNCGPFLQRCNSSQTFLNRFDYEGNLLEYWDIGVIHGYEGGMTIDPATGDILLVTADAEDTDGNNIYRISTEVEEAAQYLGYFENGIYEENAAGAEFNSAGELVITLDYFQFSNTTPRTRLYKIDYTGASPFNKTLLNTCLVAPYFNEPGDDSAEPREEGALGFNRLEDNFYTFQVELCDEGTQQLYSLYTYNETDGIELVGSFDAAINDFFGEGVDDQVNLFGISGMSIYCSVDPTINPYAISPLDEGNPVDQLNISATCGDVITIEYLVQPIFDGPITEDISIFAFLPPNYTLVPGDGITGFASSSITVPGTSSVGTVITLTLESTIPLAEGSTSDVLLYSTSPDVTLCNFNEVTITAIGVCKGDFNNDGFVTVADLAGFLNVFGGPASDCAVGDFDNNASITVIDLAGFLSAFGTECSGGGGGGNGFASQGAPINLDQTLAKLRDELSASEFQQVKSLIQSKVINVYPNPISSKMELDLMSSYSSSLSTEIKVYDARGVEIYSASTEDLHVEINTENWSSGIYFCHVGNAEFSIVKKIIKQ